MDVCDNVFISLLCWNQLAYINGRPFVLRDVERPFSNLEYTVCYSGAYQFCAGFQFSVVMLSLQVGLNPFTCGEFCT